MKKSKLDELEMIANEKWNMAKTLRDAAEKILDVAKSLDVEVECSMYKIDKAKKTKRPLMRRSSKKLVIG